MRGQLKPETPKCGAKIASRPGEFCKRAAGHGTDHLGVGCCKYHGGTAPTHRVHAERVMAAQEVARLGLPVEIDAQEALLQEVHRSAGAVAYLQRIISALDDDELVQEDRLPGGGSVISKSVWVEMYDAERRLLIQASQAAIRCGVAERQVRIAERQGELIANAVRAILQALGVADHPDAAEVVRRELKAAGARLYALPAGIEDAQIVG